MKKIVWVTGGTKGLGREIVLSFAKEGHVVITNYSNDEYVAEEFRKEIIEKNYNVQIIKADVCNLSELEAVKSVIQKYGKLDILVNNAGVGRTGSVFQMDVLEFSEVVNVNLIGKYNCIRLCVSMLRKASAPCIVNVSSASGLRASVGMGAYCSAQAGVCMMTQVLAKELISLGIRVNSVCPSMLEGGMSLKCFSIGDREKVSSYHPMRRLGTFKEIVSCIRWLCSDESSYVNGENIMVTGGS